MDFRPRALFSIEVLRNILFSIAYGLFVILFLKLFKPKTVRKLFGAALIMLVLLYFSQDIYYLIANNFYSFAMAGEIGRGFTFIYRIPQTISLGHALYLIPITVFIIIMRYTRGQEARYFDIRYKNVWQPLIFGIIAISSLTIAIASIDTSVDKQSEFDYSDYDLYREPTVPHAAMRKFGVLSYARLDLQNAIRPRQSEEDDDSVKVGRLIDEFLQEQPEHVQNVKTGIFEDQNFIMIMAEALDTYAIDPHLMPNLYNLKQESWVFENFYAPLYYRNTADTEFMIQTGFYPNKNVQLSQQSYLENTFPHTFPRLFKEQGYTSYAFHNFSDHFYPRKDFHPQALGYDAYFGEASLGLEVPDNDERDARGHYWHSDVELFEKGLPHLLEHDQFLGYFLTVTGHLPYDGNRHDIARANLEIIDPILDATGREDIDESLKYYHAAQWEFDQALGELLDTLEAEGVRDNTVIAIFGDHYAYGLEQDTIWDYDTKKDDSSLLNIHNVPFILHHPKLNHQTFDNIFSSVDVLPTLANMFNLPFNHQDVIGQDAFNNAPNQVIFSSTSFLSRYIRYEVETDTFTHLRPDSPIDDERGMIGRVYHLIRINNLILEHDYFSDDFDASESIDFDAYTNNPDSWPQKRRKRAFLIAF